MAKRMLTLAMAVMAALLAATPAQAGWDGHGDRGWRGHRDWHDHDHGWRDRGWGYGHRRYHDSGFSLSFSSVTPVYPVYYDEPYYQPAPAPIVISNLQDEPESRYCREYQTRTSVGGRLEEAYGTACMQPDGSWEIVK